MLLNISKKKNKSAKIYLIIGSDNLINFHKWQNYKKIGKTCILVVYSRKGFDKKAKATKVKYKGMNLDMDLVFVKEVDENEGGPYPVLAEYYNEIYEEEVNGVYKLTKSGNWYYAEYTRKSDSKVFNFTIDIGANNFVDSPCF